MAGKYGYMATIGADTSGITESLKDLEAESKNISREIKAINEGLKLDEGNTENITAKYNTLSQAVENTRKKLEILKQAQEKVDAAVKNGDISAEQQKNYARDVANTESQLRTYEQQLKNTQIQLKKAEADTKSVADETKDLSAQTKKADQSFDDASESALKFGDILKANLAADYIKVGIDRLIDGVKDFVKESIDVTSNLSEVKNVVDTTFQEASKSVYDFAENADKAYGLSSLAAQSYAGTLGAMMKSQGIAQEQILEMSTTLAGLSGDMASFYNLDTDTAFEKIRSGLSGESEPLKQLGIDLSETSNAAFAAANNFEKAWKNMSAGEKSIVRYQNLMAQTADVQGDFVKTSDNYANQSRIFQLEIENLQASFGEKLLPVLTETFHLINEELPESKNAIESAGEALGSITKFAVENHETIINLAVAYGTFYATMKAGAAIDAVVTSLKALKAANQAATTAQLAQNAAAKANPYVLIASVIASLTVGIISYAKSIDEATNSVRDVEQATNDIVSAGEAEAATAALKAERYRALYEEYKKTGEASEELKLLAEDLQEIAPGTIDLIDEETGAYLELSDSIESVIENLRRKSYEEAQNTANQMYYDNITKATTKYIDAQQKFYDEVSNIQDGTDELRQKVMADLEKYGESSQYYTNYVASTDWQNNPNELNEGHTIYNIVWQYMSARAGLIEAERKYNETVEEAQKNIADVNKKFDAMVAAEFGSDDTGIAPDSTMAEYYEKQGKERAAALSKGNEASLEELSNFDKELEAALSEIDKKYKTHNIVTATGEKDEVEYYRRRKEYLEEHVNKSSELWWKYYDEIIDYERKKADEQKEIAEKAADEQKNLAKAAASAEVDAWEASVSKAASAVSSAYKDLIDKKEKAFNDLSGIDLTSAITDKDGNEQTILTDLNAATKELEEYQISLERLKSTGISENLLGEILNMSYEDGSRQQFIDTLLSLDPSKLQLYYDDYAKYTATAESVAREQVASKLSDINAETATSVDEIFRSMPPSAYESGVETAQSFLQGIYDSMGGEVDLNTARAILNINGAASSNIAPSETNTGNAQTTQILSTPITINLNDKDLIEMTIGELLSQGTLTGKNAYSF